MLDEGRQQFEQHKAREIQRQKQQGLGRPIISTEFKGFRFVAVANKMYYGKWQTFSDFLGHYLKDVFGAAWGNAEIAKPLSERHPILQWYEKLCHLQAAHAKQSGALFTTPLTGAVSAYNRLAYNLYLIAHNGEDIQTRLVSRLKNNDSFQGAFHETQVAAWLIKAGFELEFEDEDDRTSTHCEFTATHTATGEKFSVEAKSRQIELGKASRLKIGRSLYDALVKKANHKRLVFIDLNKPLHTPDHAFYAMDRAERIIKSAELQNINGAPAPEAYVCLTNTNDQYALDTPAVAMLALFLGFKIPDFMARSYVSFREAARARERHFPVFQLFKSIEEHRDIPQTFGGELPSEVFATKPKARMQVGQIYRVSGPSGAEVDAMLTQALVHDGKAVCAFFDESTDQAWIATLPLTADEIADYERHPDTYFGINDVKTGRKAETPMEIFDFFVEVYRNTPKARLIEMLANGGMSEDLQAMSQIDLAELLAERYATYAISQGAGNQPKRRKVVGNFGGQGGAL